MLITYIILFGGMKLSLYLCIIVRWCNWLAQSHTVETSAGSNPVLTTKRSLKILCCSLEKGVLERTKTKGSSLTTQRTSHPQIVRWRNGRRIS